MKRIKRIRNELLNAPEVLEEAYESEEVKQRYSFMIADSGVSIGSWHWFGCGPS